MILNENQKYLNNRFPYLKQGLENDRLDEEKNLTIKMMETRLNHLTLQVIGEEKLPLFIHSKYDPIKEAERLLNQYANEVKQYKHVFFYGLGFGYHVELFKNRYPQIPYTIYEPNPEIFNHLVSNRLLSSVFSPALANLYVEYTSDDAVSCLQHYAQQAFSDVLIIILPSYERAFAQQVKRFQDNFKKTVQEKVYSLSADAAFAKRWTLNSLMNLKTTLNTPNMLKDKSHHFKGKPVIIASAGPSLAEEFEHLRYIKENGLAYIIAVGSANKAFIKNNLLPDAVCTYDPQEHNYHVFGSMIKQGIDSVPMIYGTSVGYETVQKYQGPKIHFLTVQDTITPYFLSGKEQIDCLDDAFSIAIVALQLFAKMEVGSIILVGQNFAFKNNLYYTNEVSRGIGKSAEVTEDDLFNTMKVKDVHGQQVQTNENLNEMRLMMERYIKTYSNINVFNTTMGGANIEGAAYIPLKELIKNNLTSKVVNDNWSQDIHEQNIFDEEKKAKKLLKAMNSFIELYHTQFKIISRIQQEVSLNRSDRLNSFFQTFDKGIKAIHDNEFFSVYIRPITRVEYELLHKKVSDIQKEQDLIVKAQKTTHAFSLFLQACRKVFNEISPVGKRVLTSIVDSKNDEQYKTYNSDCGIFSYSDGWKKHDFYPDEKSKEPLFSYYLTQRKGASIKFKFKGTSLRLFAGKRKDCSANVTVKIDGFYKKNTIKELNRDENFIYNFYELVFEMKNLINKLHEVEIRLEDEQTFLFNGVAIDADGQLCYLDEVIDPLNITIGKKIRCHYIASHNKVGEFLNLGKETAPFIPIESLDSPKGDFYFICVDRNLEGQLTLVADRNIQHSISWNQLNKEGIILGTNIPLGDYSVLIRLLDGGEDSLNNDNEWEKYIVNFEHTKEDLEAFWNLSRERIVSSWTKRSPSMNLDSRINTHNRAVNRGGKEKGLHGFHHNDKSRNDSWLGYRPLVVLDQTRVTKKL